MKFMSFLIITMCCFSSHIFGIDIYVNAPSDRIDVFKGDVGQNIQHYFKQYAFSTRTKFHAGNGTVGSIARSYFTPVSATEKEDIAYIVNTLSDQPTPKLLFYKSSLNNAGDRVNHVHPINFLGVIFTDDVLKVKIRNIKRKGWVWKDFMGGLRNSLNEEKSKGNLKNEFFEDFALRVDVEYRKIKSSINKANWDELVNVLIKNAESQGDNDRYNM